MTDLSPNNTIEKRRRRVRLWAWIGVVVLCLGGGSLRLWQNQQRQAAQAAWDRQRVQIYQASQQALQRIRRVRKLVRGSDGRLIEPTKADTETQLNQGRPFRIVQHGEQQTAVWT